MRQLDIYSSSQNMFRILCYFRLEMSRRIDTDKLMRNAIKETNGGKIPISKPINQQQYFKTELQELKDHLDSITHATKQLEPPLKEKINKKQIHLRNQTIDDKFIQLLTESPNFAKRFRDQNIAHGFDLHASVHSKRRSSVMVLKNENIRLNQISQDDDILDKELKREIFTSKNEPILLAHTENEAITTKRSSRRVLDLEIIKPRQRYLVNRNTLNDELELFDYNVIDKKV